MAVLLLLLLVVAALLSVHIFITPLFGSDDVVTEKANPSTTKSKDCKDCPDSIGEESRSRADCKDSPKIGEECPSGCKLSDVSCVDCRSMEKMDCEEHSECKWENEQIRNDFRGDITIPGKCSGIVHDPQNGRHYVKGKKAEHCDKFNEIANEADKETECNNDPYCFFATEEADIANVKPGVAFVDSWGSAWVEEYHMEPAKYAQYEEKNGWYQKSLNKNRLCLPLRCEKLSAEACMREAVADPTDLTSSGKRHCTVSNSSSPTCTNS